MAHVGQEFALQAAAFLGSLRGFGQLRGALSHFAFQVFEQARQLLIEALAIGQGGVQLGVGFVELEGHLLEIVDQLDHFERRVFGQGLRRRLWTGDHETLHAFHQALHRTGKASAHPMGADGGKQQAEQHPAGGDRVVIHGLHQHNGFGLRDGYGPSGVGAGGAGQADLSGAAQGSP